jgi:Poly-beta-hydroxybutyrate polymerase (PhaC) N-terminus
LNPQRLASAAIGTLRRGANYTSQLASIVTGGSPIGPDNGDRRFADPAFTDHPIYRRVMQGYLALCSQVDAAVAEADLQWKDKELLQFFRRHGDVLTRTDKRAPRQSGRRQAGVRDWRRQPGARPAQLFARRAVQWRDALPSQAGRTAGR